MKITEQYGLRKVDVIIYPGFNALDAIGPIDVLEHANARLLAQQLPRAYDIRIASTRIGPIQSETVVSLPATKRIDTSSIPHTAIIVGAKDIELALIESGEIVTWLGHVAPEVGRLVSLCSGSFFLAEAGILDGKRATTHWSTSDRLKQRYPKVQVGADAIFTRHGNIWTSAGVTAGIDLALALVEEDLGRDTALAVARDLVVYVKRPGGQSQLSVHLASQATDQPLIRGIQEWILGNLADKLPIPHLARRAATSTRNFTRMFCAATGCTPSEFIESARCDLARRLLEDAGLPLKTIAARCGFGTTDQFRRVFQRRLGVTPRAYSERVAGAQPTGARSVPRW